MSSWYWLVLLAAGWFTGFYGALGGLLSAVF